MHMGTEGSERNNVIQHKNKRTSSNNNNSSSSRDTSSSRDGESRAMDLGWGSSGTDGYQLSLAVASAACNAVTGMSAESGGLPKDSTMDLQRPCLQAHSVAETLQEDLLEVCVVGFVHVCASTFVCMCVRACGEEGEGD